MKRATPRFSAAIFMSVREAAVFSCSVSFIDSGSAPSRKPLMSGVLPSFDTSDASIWMWRHAGLSTERLFEPWMSDWTGPRPHDLPLVVSSMYTHPSDPPPTLPLPLGDCCPDSPISASTFLKRSG